MRHAAVRQVTGPMLRAADIIIDVIVDNQAHDPEMETWWGLSFLVRGAQRTILFDTGADGDALLSNMSRMGVQPAEIEIVVLSHAHWDHTGGLDALLRQDPRVEVYAPGSGSGMPTGATIVNGPLTICDHVHSTGVMGATIPEQSLVMDTDRGLVIVTGCAHPGVLSIIERSRELFGEEVLAVIGGFHLFRQVAGLSGIVERFRALGVKRVGPCHCTGDEARSLFALEYGPDFIEIGAGARCLVTDGGP